MGSTYASRLQHIHRHSDLSVGIESIPDVLRNRNQWVIWRYVNGRKLPINPQSGTAAKSDDATTWSAYSIAHDYVKTHNRYGLGYVFSHSDPYVGVDLDSCIDDGVIAPWAAQLIAAFNTYAEVSPSGTGVKLWLRGTLARAIKTAIRINPDGSIAPFKAAAGAKLPAIEMYAERRFFTVTGQRVAGTPQTINDAQAALNTLAATLRPAPAQRPPAARPQRRQSSTSDNARQRRADAILDRAVSMVTSAADGQRHNARLAAARLAGGLVPLGLADESEIEALLYAAQPPARSSESERKTIRDGIAYGIAAPLDLIVNERQQAPASTIQPWQPPALERVQTVCERYITLPQALPGVLLVKSAMGTGKTEAVAVRVADPDVSVLVITHRVALARQQAQRLNCELYQDATNVHNCTRIVTTADSLHKLSTRQQFEYVIIDESEQFLAHLTGRTLRDRRQQTMQYLIHFLRRAQHVIYLDAHLGNLTAAHAKRVHGAAAIHTLINTYTKPAPTVHRAATKADLLATLHTNITSGQTAYVASNSKAQAKSLLHDLTVAHPQARITAIHSGNSQTPEMQSFITNINERVNDVDVLICSPSVGTGVSIDTLHFDACYLIGEAQVTTHYDLLQQIGRVRTTRQNTLYTWISPRTGYEPTEPEIITRWALDNAAETGVLINIDEHSGTIDGQPDDQYLPLYADVQAHRNASINTLEANFYAELTAMQCNIIDLVAGDDARTEARQRNRDARTAVREAEHAAIIAAPQLTESEYHELKAQYAATADEQDAVTRYEMCNFYGAEPDQLSTDLIAFDEAGGRSKVSRFVDMLHPDLARASDHAELARTLPDRRHHAAAAELRLMVLGATRGGVNLTDTDDSRVALVVTDELVQLVEANRERIKRLLGLTVKKVDMRFIVRVLAQIGVKVSRRQSHDGSRTYFIDDASITLMHQLSAAHIARRRAIAVVEDSATRGGVNLTNTDDSRVAPATTARQIKPITAAQLAALPAAALTPLQRAILKRRSVQPAT